MEKEIEEELSDSNDVSKTLEYVSVRMKEVRKHGLESEVICWALEAMKSDPSLSIEEALNSGCLEWDI